MGITDTPGATKHSDSEPVMDMHTRHILASATLVLTVGIAGCSDDPIGTSPLEEIESQIHRMTVVEDTAALQDRIRHMDRELPVVGEPGSGGGPAMAPVEGVRLYQVAEIDPPEVDGFVLQATHVALEDDRAFVAYNLQGPLARGAVDVIERIDRDEPRFVSSALLNDTEVNAVAMNDDRLFLATAVEEGAWHATAAVESARFRGWRDALDGFSNRAALPSFAANGIALRGDRVFATSGDIGGGLTILDRRSLRELSFDAFDDARSVVVDRDRIVVLKGSPAELRVYDEDSGRLERTIALGGELPEASKAGLALADDVAAVAMGRGGVKVVDLDSGRILDELAFPEVEGVAPEDVVANEVAIHDDLIFVAAGGAGLRVIRANRDLDRIDRNDDVELHWAGYVDFGEAISVNFVTREGTRLYVAGGSGGLRVITFRD